MRERLCQFFHPLSVRYLLPSGMEWTSRQTRTRTPSYSSGYVPFVSVARATLQLPPPDHCRHFAKAPRERPSARDRAGPLVWVAAGGRRAQEPRPAGWGDSGGYRGDAAPRPDFAATVAAAQTHLPATHYRACKR